MAEQLRTLKETIWTYTIDDSTDESEMWERKAFANDLREEARKWHNALRKFFPDEDKKYLNGKFNPDGCTKSSIAWIEYFFDLEEDD